MSTKRRREEKKAAEIPKRHKKGEEEMREKAKIVRSHISNIINNKLNAIFYSQTSNTAIPAPFIHTVIVNRVYSDVFKIREMVFHFNTPFSYQTILDITKLQITIAYPQIGEGKNKAFYQVPDKYISFKTECVGEKQTMRACITIASHVVEGIELSNKYFTPWNRIKNDFVFESLAKKMATIISISFEYGRSAYEYICSMLLCSQYRADYWLDNMKFYDNSSIMEEVDDICQVGFYGTINTNVPIESILSHGQHINYSVQPLLRPNTYDHIPIQNVPTVVPITTITIPPPTSVDTYIDLWLSAEKTS